MPLYNHECRKCGAVFEALIAFDSKAKVYCNRCGGESLRSEVSRFRILGAVQKGRDRGQSATDLVSNADSFVSAMNSFGDKIGDRLSNRQMERAVENLRKAKR
jgi:putative FmdB family regulatory protein